MLRLVARYADNFDADYQTGPPPVLERLAGLEAACREVGARSAHDRAHGGHAGGAGRR